MKKAVFLDRDGVINKRLIGDYVKKPEELEIFPWVKDSLKKLKKMGYKIIVITNQQGIGKGLMSISDLKKVHEKMIDEIKYIDDIKFCPDLEEDKTWHRKPRPGMLLEAIEEWKIDPTKSWMIGDSESDIIAGAAIGCNTIIVGKKRCILADYHAKNLKDAVRVIEKNKICNIMPEIKLYIKMIYLYGIVNLSSLISTLRTLLKINKKITDEELKEKILMLDRADNLGDTVVTLPFIESARKRYTKKFKLVISKNNPLEKTLTKKMSSNIVKINNIKRIKNKEIILIPSTRNLQYLLKELISNKNKVEVITSRIGMVFNRNTRYYMDKRKQLKTPLSLSITEVFERKESIINKMSDVPDVIKEIIKDTKVNINTKKYIVFFVHAKKFRNLYPYQWCRIIENIKFNGHKVIIDYDNKINKILSKICINEKNLIFMNKLTPEELIKIGSNAKLVIGVEGGGFHTTQVASNSFEIITYGEQSWFPFSCKKYKIAIKGKKGTIYKTKTKNNLIKMVYYPKKNVFFRLANEVIKHDSFKIKKEIELELIIKAINDFLKNYDKQ